MSQNIVLLLIFFQPIKNVKTILRWGRAPTDNGLGVVDDPSWTSTWLAGSSFFASAFFPGFISFLPYFLIHSLFLVLAFLHLPAGYPIPALLPDLSFLPFFKHDSCFLLLVYLSTVTLGGRIS